jgi:hypothetical protein
MTRSLDELKNLVKRAREKACEFAPLLARLPETMVSPEEAYAAYLLATEARSERGVVAELGAYTGGTSCVFGEALRAASAAPKTLEVYDFFKHNAKSRRRMRGQPLFERESFFRTWEAHTRPYADLIDVFVGDLIETQSTSQRPISLLYVDVVKHEALINPVMQSFMRRLLVGAGIIFHQDYFHWQSPWIVYAMEKVRPYLEAVGTISNHAAVFRLVRAIPEELLTLDYVTGLSWPEKLALMDAAIERFGGLRGALLTVSKFNLALEYEDFDFDLELERSRPKLLQPRVMLYINALLRQREEIRKKRRTAW